jgi:DNA-binding transcriptional MerR regulator
MKIQEFSRLTGIGKHTLRYYEKIGLLQVERDASGHRYYASGDAKWVRCIKRLKDSDMPLKDIRAFASMRHQCNGPDCERLQILTRHKVRLEEELEAVRLRLAAIDEEIALFKVWNNLSS